MPSKLITVIVLLVIGVVLNIATGSYLSAVLGGILVGFLASGSHTARTIAIWLTVAGLALLAWTVIDASRQVSLSRVPGWFWAVLAFGVLQAVFTIWALTRDDVVAWMDERSGGGARRGGGDEPPKYV